MGLEPSRQLHFRTSKMDATDTSSRLPLRPNQSFFGLWSFVSLQFVFLGDASGSGQCALQPLLKNRGCFSCKRRSGTVSLEQGSCQIRSPRCSDSFHAVKFHKSHLEKCLPKVRSLLGPWFTFVRNLRADWDHNNCKALSSFRAGTKTKPSLAT